MKETVETALGTIVVSEIKTPEQAGIVVTLERDGTMMPIADIMCSTDELDYPKGKPCLVTKVFGDGNIPSYTDRIVHDNIDSYFAAQKEKDKITKAEQCLIDNGIEPDEAATVLQALGYILMDKELYPEKEGM